MLRVGGVIRRAATLRAADEGDVLEGVLLRYGVVYDLGRWRESVERGAFGPGPVADLDVVANRQHSRVHPIGRTGGGGLTLEEVGGDVRFRLEATTDLGRAVVADVRAGILRGASVEMVPRQVARGAAGLRRIVRARLLGLGIVDRQAYAGSTVEARAEGAVTPLLALL